tara:strand:+ start:285 stop:722 length:438 start_codon:yes stop_codon:yes gene_type:complete
MSPKLMRLFGLLMFLSFLALGTFFLLSALNSNIVYFFGPTQIINKDKNFWNNRRIRLGGLVENGSIAKNGIDTNFIITDGNSSIKVIYSGLLPDLFSENQGVIVEGLFTEQIFTADIILAKHDENYMPREVAEDLKLKGVWKGNK